MRPPSALGMTVGSPPSMTATTEFVVPRSMPMILPIGAAPESGVVAVVVGGAAVALAGRVAGPRAPAPGAGRGRGGGSPAGARPGPRRRGARWSPRCTTASCSRGSKGWPTASMGVTPSLLEQLAELAVDGRDALDPARCRPARRARASIARSKSSATAEDLESRTSLASPSSRSRSCSVRRLKLAKSARGALPAGPVVTGLLLGRGELAAERLDLGQQLRSGVGASSGVDALLGAGLAMDVASLGRWSVGHRFGSLKRTGGPRARSSGR